MFSVPLTKQQKKKVIRSEKEIDSIENKWDFLFPNKKTDEVKGIEQSSDDSNLRISQQWADFIYAIQKCFI